jgi:hypothetical protein
MAPPEVWGPPVWNFIHTLADKVNEDAFNTIKHSLFSILKKICFNLPCPECSQHAKHFLLRVNVSSIHSKNEFKHMLFVFHNAVNKRKRKQLFPYSHIEKYKFMNIPNTYNNFITAYNTKGNLSLIMESFQRSIVIKELNRWLYINNKFFKEKKTHLLVHKPDCKNIINETHDNIKNIDIMNQIDEIDKLSQLANFEKVKELSEVIDEHVILDKLEITNIQNFSETSQVYDENSENISREIIYDIIEKMIQIIEITSENIM